MLWSGVLSLRRSINGFFFSHCDTIGETSNRRAATEVLPDSAFRKMYAVRVTIGSNFRTRIGASDTRTRPVGAPKLGAFLPAIDEILQTDQSAPPKQRHTVAQIFRLYSHSATVGSRLLMATSTLGMRKSQSWSDTASG